jgi:hypothetical protein
VTIWWQRCVARCTPSPNARATRQVFSGQSQKKKKKKKKVVEVAIIESAISIHLLSLALSLSLTLSVFLFLSFSPVLLSCSLFFVFFFFFAVSAATLAQRLAAAEAARMEAAVLQSRSLDELRAIVQQVLSTEVRNVCRVSCKFPACPLLSASLLEAKQKHNTEKKERLSSEKENRILRATFSLSFSHSSPHNDFTQKEITLVVFFLNCCFIFFSFLPLLFVPDAPPPPFFLFSWVVISLLSIFVLICIMTCVLLLVGR